MARDDPGRGGTEIFIYTRDQDNLFALITSILDQLGLTILDARIITGHSGYTLDSFTVLEDPAADPGTQPDQGNRHRAPARISSNRMRAAAPSRHISRIQKAFQMPTWVSFPRG
jgi:[protein-PII] uridylyltransferase